MIVDISTLKNRINSEIRSNGVNAITGPILNTELIDIIDSLYSNSCTSFYQETSPTALNTGDIWFDGINIYRWSGSSWIDVLNLEAVDIPVDSSSFTQNLDETITDVQLLADAVDQLSPVSASILGSSNKVYEAASLTDRDDPDFLAIVNTGDICRVWDTGNGLEAEYIRTSIPSWVEINKHIDNLNGLYFEKLEATTEDNSWTTLKTYTTNTGDTVAIHADLVCRSSDDQTKIAHMIFVCSVNNTTGTVAKMYNEFSLKSEKTDDNFDCRISVSTDTWSIDVKGLTANSVDWQVMIQYHILKNTVTQSVDLNQSGLVTGYVMFNNSSSYRMRKEKYVFNSGDVNPIGAVIYRIVTVGGTGNNFVSLLGFAANEVGQEHDLTVGSGINWGTPAGALDTPYHENAIGKWNNGGTTYVNRFVYVLDTSTITLDEEITSAKIKINVYSKGTGTKTLKVYRGLHLQDDLDTILSSPNTSEIGLTKFNLYNSNVLYGELDITSTGLNTITLNDAFIYDARHSYFNEMGVQLFFKIDSETTTDDYVRFLDGGVNFEIKYK